MPSRAPRLQFPDQVVTAVVVVHDGAAWLPDCLEAVRAQRRRPQRLVVVDTGSSDGSADLVRSAGDDIEVVRLPRDTGLGAALQAGVAAADALPAVRRRGPVVEWLWVVHDDCRPEPGALLELLAEADRSPSATVLGCKQTDLDGQQLVEMGVTVDGSGRRRTTVGSHEVDQGQYDDLRDVLAVGTAGMLVRRDVWDRLGGLDQTWAFHGEDVDFGWRANLAGERVVVVPRAVVRHAFALTGGARPAAPEAGRPGVVRRRHELQVLWANAGGAVLPLLLVRTVLGSWLVGLARLTSGDLRGARDETGAVVSAMRHPSTVVDARRRRRPLRMRSHAEVRPLLGSASTQIRRDIAARLGHWQRSGGEGGRRGWRDRPLLWLSLGLLALALVADRGVLSGSLHGGRLLPSAGGASDLWSAYVAGWHPVGLGSTAPAPPWLAVLAALSTVLFGKPWLVVCVLMLGAVPLSGWTAYAAGSGLTRSRALRAWAAATYALLPVGLGAVAGGRLDVVVVAVLLPISARALLAATSGGRRGEWPSRRRAIAAGLLLAVTAAFAPMVWAVLGLCGFAAIVVGVRPVGRGLARLALALGVAFVVLMPWSWHVAAHPALALRGLGPRDGFALPRAQDATDFLLLHPGGPAQPAAWLAAGLLLAGVAGLVRRAGGRLARAGFSAFVVAVGAALAVSRLEVTGSDAGARHWTGVPLAVAGLALLCSAVVAADGARAVLARHSFGWRQLTATLIAATAAVATFGFALAWAGRGVAGPLTGRDPQLLPEFAAAAVTLPPSPRALVLRPAGDRVDYALVRSASGPALGDADLATARDETGRGDARLADAVARLAGGDPQAASLLTELGVSQVADRAADEPRLAGLARVDGLTAVPASGVVIRRVAAPAGELVLLAPEPAATVRAGGGLPAGVSPIPLPSTAGRARTRIPAGESGRLLVLAETADRHWRATVDGRELPRSTAYGWAQAWTVPSAGGRLAISRTSDGRSAWLLGQLAVLVLLVLAARPVRRRAGGPA